MNRWITINDRYNTQKQINVHSIQYANGKNTTNSVSCISGKLIFKGYVFLSLNTMLYLDQHKTNAYMKQINIRIKHTPYYTWLINIYIIKEIRPMLTEDPRSTLWSIMTFQMRITFNIDEYNSRQVKPVQHAFSISSSNIVLLTGYEDYTYNYIQYLRIQLKTGEACSTFIQHIIK